MMTDTLTYRNLVDKAACRVLPDLRSRKAPL